GDGGRASSRSRIEPGPGAKSMPSCAKYSRNEARMPCSVEARAKERSAENSCSSASSGAGAGAAQAATSRAAVPAQANLELRATEPSLVACTFATHGDRAVAAQ